MERCNNLKRIVLENLDEKTFSNAELKHIHTYLEYNRARVLQMNGEMKEASRAYRKVLKSFVFRSYTLMSFVFMFMLFFKRDKKNH
jgi:hypothetical protein